jgi:hypothetical protein
MQTAIYRNHQNPESQHQALVMEVAVGHILYGQFKVRLILSRSDQWDWDISKKRL